MRSKFFVFTVLVLALILSACGPTTINQPASSTVRTLTVTGVGQTDLTPDIAYIYIGVHNEEASASTAVASNKADTTKVIDAIKNAGVDPKDIRTSNFSIYPSQKYATDGSVTGTTYMVDNNVYVTVRNIDSLGNLLDDAVNAGANSINSIQFDVADKTSALKDARAKAVEDAKSQAQEMATTAGVTLGAIQSISFYDNVPSPVVYGGKGGGAAMATDTSVPVQPGQLTISASVNIVYLLK